MMPTPSYSPGHCPGIRLARREPRNLPTLRRLVKQKESEPAWQKRTRKRRQVFLSRRGGGHAHLRLINFSLLLGRRSPSHALLVLMVFFPFIFSRTTSSQAAAAATRFMHGEMRQLLTPPPGQTLPRSAMSSFTSQLRRYLSRPQNIDQTNSV